MRRIALWIATVVVWSLPAVSSSQDVLIREGDVWDFFRGRSEPPVSWPDHDFDVEANGWEAGPTGIGYGDDDDLTVLDDMQGSYLSVYARRPFRVAAESPNRVLVLRVRYDDGFVAYIDGREVARRGVEGARPAFDVQASSLHEIAAPFGFDEEIVLDLDAAELLPDADHVLAAQTHNAELDSSDLSFSAELVAVPFVVREVSPRFGPVEGGNEVMVGGVGFAADDVPVVRFGAREAPEVSVVEGGLRVVVPAASSESVVSVTVQDSRGSVTLEEAYRYGPPRQIGLFFDGQQLASAVGLGGRLEEGTLQFWYRRQDEFFDFFYRVLFALEDAGGGDAVRFEARANNLRWRTFVGGEANDLVAEVPLPAETWHHVAFTFSARGRRIYLDGALVAQDGLAVSYSEADRARLGAGFSGGFPLSGTVESVSISFFEKTELEIASELFASVEEQYRVDIGWPLDEGAGQTARDVGRFDVELVLGESSAPEGSDPAWTELDDFPTIAVTAVSPAYGPLGGGNLVSIFGGGFPTGGSAVSVAFGGEPSPDVEVVAGNELVVEVPAGSSFGVVDVRVTTPRGTVVLEGGYTYVPDRVDDLVREGDEWSYHVAVTGPPPADWAELGFDADDAGWARGPSGLGYGDDDDATVVFEMQGQALTLFARREFSVASEGEAVRLLRLRARYDDGFVAYLNGTEIARRNVAGQPPAWDEPASDQHEIGVPSGEFDEEIDVTAWRNALRRGTNVLAVEAHNATIDSSDLSISLELDVAVDEVVEGPAFIRGDVDGDEKHTVNDAVRVVLLMFRGAPIACEESADIDDDGGIDLADVLYLLDFVFRRGAPPPPPFEMAQPDVDDDPLACEAAPSGLVP